MSEGSSMPLTPSHDDSDRLSAVERDVVHLSNEFSHLRGEFRESRAEVREEFSSLRRLVENQRQPITAFAGWGAIILTLVGAVLYPQMKSDDEQKEWMTELGKRFFEAQKESYRYHERVDKNVETLGSLSNLTRDRDLRISGKVDRLMELHLDHVQKESHVGAGVLLRDIRSHSHKSDSSEP
jgi:hypothetical protein